MRLPSATGPGRTVRRVALLHKRYNLSAHLGQAVTHDADWFRDLSHLRVSRRFETAEPIAQGCTNAALAREMPGDGWETSGRYERRRALELGPGPFSARPRVRVRSSARRAFLRLHTCAKRERAIGPREQCR
jgi:hypothetical protein